MIRSITRQKSEEELEQLLNGLQRIFIIGCGTCATLTNTGGEPQVQEMKEKLIQKGRIITGTTVLPVACDHLSHEVLREHYDYLIRSDAILVMSCAFGVQSVSRGTRKMVIPALDTLFIGKETSTGTFNEICSQCGDCIIGETGGICPVTSCHKGLVNGPCGGTNKGKCEIDPDKDCAWILIYNRLKELKRLDSMKRFQSPRNHQRSPSPGKFRITEPQFIQS